MLYSSLLFIFWSQPLDALFFVDAKGEYFFHLEPSQQWSQVELRIDAIGYANVHDTPEKQISINGRLQDSPSGLDVKVAMAKPSEGEVVEFYVPTIFIPRETPSLSGDEFEELPPISWRWKLQMFLTDLGDKLRGNKRKKTKE